MQTANEQTANRTSAGADQSALAAADSATNERAAHSADTHVLFRGGAAADRNHGNHGNNHLPHGVILTFVLTLISSSRHLA
ncbi:hypothetical protein X759_24210 [Mesorhizobium sp. LSHC420B00]|nr:hypothetical protein X759_24210 [Mesorhizobium sp. LSHC420B00]